MLGNVPVAAVFAREITPGLTSLVKKLEQTTSDGDSKAGLSPMQAIVAATGGAARVMKVNPQIGTLEAGKMADLLVLDANPLADIRNTRRINGVWIGGHRLAVAGVN